MIYNAGTHSNGIFRQKFEHAAFSIVVPLWVIFVNLLSKNKKKLFYYSVLFSISIANIILIIFSDLFITQTLYLFKGFKNTSNLTELFRRRVISYFVEKKLLNEKFA